MAPVCCIFSAETVQMGEDVTMLQTWSNSLSFSLTGC